MQIRQKGPPRDSVGIIRHIDGTCDITLADIADHIEDTYVINVYTMSGVRWHPDIEERIRANFDAWVAHAAALENEIKRIHMAIIEIAERIKEEEQT